MFVTNSAGLLSHMLRPSKEAWWGSSTPRVYFSSNTHHSPRCLSKRPCVREKCLVVRRDHFQQEKFETPLGHVLSLALVAAKPCECELAHACPNLLQRRGHIWACWVAVCETPIIHMPSHVKMITHVSHVRRRYTCSMHRQAGSCLRKFMQVASVVMNDHGALGVARQQIRHKDVALA